MASNVKFTVEGKGKNLKKTAKDAKSVGDSAEHAQKGLDKAAKAGDKYHKAQKGVAGASSNSTKNFSKMRGAMGGGSSGLVGAYATLAANVFAASAAFNALRNAAQMETMIQGLQAVGASAGRNLTFAADRLREISGEALSAEASIRTMSLGISAGFRTDQMERLTVVARGASLALGRDMTDALDRLTRGTAKLEPEILDELGIMVRLDDATLKYATTLGKSVEDLTQYERRQAFLNETLEQGEKKFGELASSIDVNPYDQLSASLNNLFKIILGGFNTVLGPVIDLFVSNQKVLISAITLTGLSLFRYLLPGLGAATQAMVANSKATADEAKMKLQNLKVTQKLPKGYRNAVIAMKEGGLTQDQYRIGLTRLNQSMGQYLSIQAKNTQSTAKEIAAYKRTTIAMAEVTAAKQALIVAYQAEAAAQTKKTIADGTSLLAQGALISGTSMLFRGIMMTSASMWAGVASAGMLTKAWTALNIAGMALLRTAGGLMTVLLGPWGIALGIAAFAVWSFWDEIKEFFGIGTKEIVKNSDEAVKALEYIGEVGQKLSNKVDKMGWNADALVSGFQALNGVMEETIGLIKNLERAEEARAAKALGSLKLEKHSLFAKLQLAGATLAKEKAAGNDVGRGTGSHNKALKEVKELQEQMKRVYKEIESIPLESAKRVREGSVDIANEMVRGLESNKIWQKIGGSQIKKMKDLIQDFSKDPEAKINLMEELEKLRAPIGNITNAFSSAQEALSQFNKETNKLAQKDKTPFDAAITGAEGLLSLIEQVESGMNGEGMELSTTAKDALMAAIKDQTGASALLGSGAGMKAYVARLHDARDTIISSKAEVKKTQTELKRLNTIQGKFPKTQAMSLLLSQKQEKIRKQQLAGAKATLQNNNDLAGVALMRAQVAVEEEKDEKKKAKLREVVKQIAIEHAANMASQAVNINNLENQKVGIKEQQAKAAVDALELEKAMLSMKKAVVQAEIKLLELGMQRQRAALELSNLQNKSRIAITGGAATSPQQEYVLAVRQRDVKLDIINKNTTMMVEEAMLAKKTAKLQTQYQLLKLKILKVEYQGDKEKLGLITSLIESTTKLSEMQISAADKRITAARLEGVIAKELLNVEEQRLSLSSRQSIAGSTAGGSTVAGALGSGMQALRDAAPGTKAYIAGQVTAQKKIDDAIAKGRAQNHGNYVMTDDALFKSGSGESKSMETMLTQWTETTEVMKNSMREVFAELDVGDKFKFISGAMKPMIESFRSMGPEGAAIAEGMTGVMIGLGGISGAMKQIAGQDGSGKLFGEGGVLSAENFKNTASGGEEFAGTMEGVAGATATAAGAASALFATQKMASETGIARLDREIAMEKRRDGQSSASLAKIKKMEADKEKLKKKAFEQDKKMKMAQTVMNTATAVMMAYATMDPIGATIMSAFIVALGAKQLSLISSMQYSGGGGNAAGGTPPSVNIGSKSKKVDVAGGKPAGELSYMRGERGMGSSASDFSRRGAFTGAKYRAVGGAAYVVGEQGPEVIVPEVPGRIIPNDDLTEGGASINATFNIQTIDATNMEETLVSQRGNIINMIREAANNQGETFLENLDTMALGDSY